MRQTIAAVACGLAVLGGVGCQNFSYVQRDAQGGVIELKASEREAVIAKLQAEEGEVEIENEVVKGRPGQPFDPKAVQPSERMAATSSSGFGSVFANRDEDKLQIKYRKKTPTGVTPPGLPPAKDDGIAQAGYRTNSAYDRTPGAGMATVGGQKAGGVNGPLPAVDMKGYNPGN
jgi:hypothetical protein